MLSGIATLLVFFWLSTGLFGNTWLPLAGFVWFLNETGGDPLKGHLGLAIAFGLSCACLAILFARKRAMNWAYFAPGFMMVFVVATWAVLSVSLEVSRRAAVEKFEADAAFQHVVFWSYSQTLKPHVTYPHAAVLKDCRTYVWSYRKMAFYEIGPNISTNVLPRRWIESCGIEKTS